MRRKKKHFDRQKTMASTPSLEDTTKTSDDEPTLSQSGDPITPTPNPSNTDATKHKHGEISSVSSCNDSSMLDLNSEEVRLKIKSIVEESVRIATDAAIKAAKLIIESGLEAIFSRKIDVLEGRIFDLEKRLDQQITASIKLNNTVHDLKVDVDLIICTSSEGTVLKKLGYKSWLPRLADVVVKPICGRRYLLGMELNTLDTTSASELYVGPMTPTNIEHQA